MVGQMTDLPPKTLVLGGGGMSCIAFTGALRRLEEQHPGCVSGVDLFVGCSAGALLAFLFAMGMPPTAVRDWCYSRIIALSANELDLDGVFELVTRLGIDDGSRVDALVAEAMALWDLPSDVTFGALAKRSAKELVVCVANITRGRREFMSARTTPDVPVALAMRMTMAVPMLYTPVHYGGGVYVDGGIVENCPVSYWFSRMRASSGDGLTPALVLDLVYPVSRRNNASTLPNMWEFIHGVFNTTIGSAASRARRCRARAASHGDLAYVVVPPLTKYPFFSAGSMSFEMTTAAVGALDEAGYDAMCKMYDPPVML